MAFDIMLLDNLEPVIAEANHYGSYGLTEERVRSDGTTEILVGKKYLHTARVFIRDSLTLMSCGEEGAKVRCVFPSGYSRLLG